MVGESPFTAGRGSTFAIWLLLFSDSQRPSRSIPQAMAIFSSVLIWSVTWQTQTKLPMSLAYRSNSSGSLYRILLHIPAWRVRVRDGQEDLIKRQEAAEQFDCLRV
jgi:hypothetical protein